MLLKGKRLLHLGATMFQLPSIQAAKELGCTVIVTDNVPGNPGHRAGDISENASTVDLEACLAVARKHEVHGVITYGSDVSTPAVAYVAEQLGLQGSPLASAQILQRKDLVRNFQLEHGLNHPPFVVLSAEDDLARRLATFKFPGVMKPVDSSGSKGVSVVKSVGEAREALVAALGCSRQKLAILEGFLAQDMPELDGDVWIRDGKIGFRQYGHNYFSRSNQSMVPMGEIFPGFFGEEVIEELDRQITTLIEGLGIHNGCMNFDGCVSGGKVYLLDIALRNGGNFVPYLIQLSTGFDITKAAVCSAFGIDPPDAPPAPGAKVQYVASYLVNATREGKFDGVEVDAELRPFLFEEKVFVERGTPVLPFTRGDRALGILIFKFPDMDTLRAKIERVEDLVRTRLT